MKNKYKYKGFIINPKKLNIKIPKGFELYTTHPLDSDMYIRKK